MFNSSTVMKLLLLVCLLTGPGMTSADGHGFVTVAEGDDAVLPCSLNPKENIKQMTFDWVKPGGPQKKQVFYYVKGSHYNNGHPGQDEQFKGRVSHFEDELQFGNASIKIRETKLADNGSYKCIFPDKNQESHVTLYVGAAPEPIITSLNETKEWSLLQCKVQGVPEPKVQWRDSAGNVLQANEAEVRNETRFYIKRQIIVTKTDTYMCVATQEKIYHQINATTSVYIQEGASTSMIIGVGIGILIGVLIAVIGQKVWARYKKPQSNNSKKTQAVIEGNDEGILTAEGLIVEVPVRHY